MTTDDDLILKNRKDRTRLVYNPIGDTFGALCYMNGYII
jgi:hypothetical protein